MIQYSDIGSSVPPWFSPLRENFEQLSFLPRVLSFVSPSWIGLERFVQYCLYRLCCDQKTPCGSCLSCTLLKAGSHPDVIHVGATCDDQPENMVQHISIDDIRPIYEKLQVSPSYQSQYIVVIHQAERLTTSAANALLKILEDESLSVVFIIIVEHIDYLLPTIRSRIQVVFYAPLPRYEMEQNWILDNIYPDKKRIECLWYLSAGRPYLMAEWISKDIDKDYSELIQLCIDEKSSILTCDQAWALFKSIQRKASYHDTTLVDFIIDSLIYYILNQCLHLVVSWSSRFPRLLKLKQYSHLSVNTRLIVEQIILFK